MMDEDLALYSFLSCCRLSSVSGDPWLSFTHESEGQRSMPGGSVFMGGHWKALVRVLGAGHRAVVFCNARILEFSLLWGMSNNLRCFCSD